MKNFRKGVTTALGFWVGTMIFATANKLADEWLGENKKTQGADAKPEKEKTEKTE